MAQRELEELSRQPEAECEAMAVPEALARRREEEGAERAAELSRRLADATAEARTANAALKVGNGAGRWGLHQGGPMGGVCEHALWEAREQQGVAAEEAFAEGLSSAEASARAQRTEQLEAAARLQEVQGRCATLELAAERERKGWEGLQGEVDDAKQMHAACEGELARAREQRETMIRAFYFKHYESHRASNKLARHSDCVLNNKKQ